MSRYARGKHAISRSPRGQHAIERNPLGQHGIARPCSYYVKREIGRRSMPALGVLLSASVTAGGLSIPIRAIADDVAGDAAVSQTVEMAPDDAILVSDEQSGLLVDVNTGKAYDRVTRALVEFQLTPDALAFLRAQAQDPAAPVVPDAIDVAAPVDVAEDVGADDLIDIDDLITDPEDTDVAPDVEAPAAVVDAAAAPSASQPEASVDSVPIEEFASSQAATAEDFAAIVDDGSTLEATVTELQVALQLLNAGWTPEMIAAALGNMYAESGSNAASFCDMSGQFNYAYEVAGGLFQWTDAGSSASQLSCAGLTGLRQYAAERGAEWTDARLQADYFLKTWRDEWAARQTYYDAAYPDFADVDVSLAGFDECMDDDFDGDGIIDAWDDDVDGDGIPNDVDPVTMLVRDGEMVKSKSATASCVLPMPTTERNGADAQRHIEELTFAFMAGYEGPAANVAHLDRRIAHALRMYPAIIALDETRALDLMDTRAGLVIAGAQAMLGGTYVWAAESPSTKTFDCSGLTKWCYSLAGVGIEHYSETQYMQASKVNAIADAVVGDILWRPGHVGIYIGNGRSIEAKGVNYGIVYGDATSFTSALHFDALDQPLQ